jgi:hypothetical protein
MLVVLFYNHKRAEEGHADAERLRDRTNTHGAEATWRAREFITSQR